MSSSPDRYERALDEKRAELEACQTSRELKSCLGCDRLYDCPLRDAYVQAVYESMNKGSGGGFEF